MATGGGPLLREHHGSETESARLFAGAADRWEEFEMRWERALGQPARVGHVGLSSQDGFDVVGVDQQPLEAGSSSSTCQ